MKNNSFLIENFEEILIQKSYEELNDAEIEQLKIEKISKQEYTAMREMFLQMQEIEESEEIPNHLIKDRLMAEFAAPQKLVTKNKIIAINRWFYLGIAASLTLAFVLFYKLSENVNNIDDKQVVQKIESDQKPINSIQLETPKLNDVSEVYTEVKADTLISGSSLSEKEQSNLEKVQMEMPASISKESESAGFADDYIPPISKTTAASENKDMKYADAYRNDESASIGKRQQTVGISLAEVSNLQDFTVEIY
jgi:hypothetical protein